MIEQIVLKNTGATYTLNYVAENGEIVVAEIPAKVYDNIQNLVAYVEKVKQSKDEEVEELKNKIQQEQAQKNKYIEYLMKAEISAEAMLSLIDIFPEWSPESVAYEVDQKVRHFGRLYRVIQAHTSQSDWTPDVAVSLFAEILPDNVVAEWEQRLGHNPYQIGDKVLFEGEIWECVKITTYSPATYADAWKRVN